MIRAIEEFHNIFPRNSLVRRYIVAKYHITEEPFHFTCKQVLAYLRVECEKRSNGTWSKSDEAVHAIDSRKTDFHKELMTKLGEDSVKQRTIWIKKRDELQERMREGAQVSERDMKAIQFECGKRFKIRSCTRDKFHYKTGSVTYATTRSMKAAKDYCEMIPKGNLRDFCLFPRKYFIAPYAVETCEKLENRTEWQSECFERANGTWGVFEPTLTDAEYKDMVASEVDCDKELTYMYENMNKDEQAGWDRKNMRLKVLTDEIFLNKTMSQQDVERRQKFLCQTMESDVDIEECMIETRTIPTGKVTYATMRTKNILKDMCGIYPSSAIQCQRSCRFKIAMYKEPTPRICKNINTDWVKDCNKRTSGESQFIALPEITEKAKKIPVKPEIKSMSDKRFKLLRKEQKICHEAMANYKGDLGRALKYLKKMSKSIREGYYGLQLTDFDLERVKTVTCSGYTVEYQKIECENALEDRIRNGKVTYASHIAMLNMNRTCLLYEKVFKVPECKPFCDLSIEFYPFPIAETCT